MHGRKPGFSLAETIVALGILAGVFLVAAALLTTLLRGSQKESDRTAGIILADQILTERLQRVFAGLDPGLTKAQLYAGQAPPQPPLEGTVRLNRSVYTYQITYRTVADTGGHPLGGNASLGNRVKKLDIVVWWWTDSPEKARTGYGYLRTDLSRLVSETTTF